MKVNKKQTRKRKQKHKQNPQQFDPSKPFEEIAYKLIKQKLLTKG